ncbi:MAG: insulinase family protein [Gammaproteobacteria bacterium]|nr:insulinase family protein [Gammaproteobacteria bacterium]
MRKTITAIAVLLPLVACTGLKIEGANVSFEPYEEAPAAALPPVEIPYEKHVLDNGLTLIVHEDHKAPIVAVNVWYHVGSKDEKPGKTGFAHLFEHLMFNGSENHDDEFFRPLEQAGATKMNGTTWLDRTNYFQNVPTSALDLTLWLESDRMGHLLGAIDRNKLDEQRGVVQNEKRQGENEPYGKVDEVIAAATYPAGHPYSWTTIGSMEDLNAASLADVKEWFTTHYGAANAVLVIAGDVDPAAVKQKVEHYFGDIGSGPELRRQKSWIAPMSGTKRATMQDRVPQPRLFKVWNIPGNTERDYTLLEVASSVLAMGKNSRLYKRLVYQDQIATGVSVGLGPFELGAQFTIDVMAKPDADLRRIEQAVDEEVARLLRDGPTEAELNRIKTVSYAGWVRRLERVDGFGGKSDVLAMSQVYGGSPEFYKNWVAWERGATANDVRDAARRWLGDGVFVLDVTPLPAYQAAAQGAARDKLPATSAPPELKLPPLQRDSLSNGLKLVLAERHEAPLVNFNLIVDAGVAADQLATPGTATMMLNMLDEGTATRDALAISARAEELGAIVGNGSIQDSSYINLTAIKAKLDPSLELYADIVRNPSFPDKELARLKPLRLAAIRQEKAQPANLAFRNIRRLIFGEGHAYSNPSSGNGTEEAVKALTTADLRRFYRRFVRPDNATLLIVGDTTLAEIKPLLEKHLGGWRAPDEALPRKNVAPVALPAKPRVFLIDRPNSEQSFIVAAHVAPPKSDPDDIAMLAANTPLGDLFTSRINMNLREDKHWSYGAGSGMPDARGQRPFVVNAAVQTDKTAESMRELRRELAEVLGQRPLSADELRQAQKNMVLSLPGENETSQQVAGSFLKILTFGLPDSYYNDFVRKVYALTPAEANAAARKLLHPEALTWLVVGDLAKIEAPVRKLGFGEVTVLDADGRVLR